MSVNTEQVNNLYPWQVSSPNYNSPQGDTKGLPLVYSEYTFICYDIVIIEIT